MSKVTPAQSADDEPIFVLRASDPLSGMMLRFWANANEYPGSPMSPKATAAVRELAARMDAWRERNG